MHTKAIGDRGEDLASQWLLHAGYTIVARNFRTRWCEIDIVARKDAVIYFVEVKYRKNDLYGDGFAYVTPKKLEQMQFAAELWMQQQNYSGESLLAAISIDGRSDQIEFVELD